MTESIEDLLYREAHVLDSGLWQDWLAMLAPGLRYWAPSRAEVPRQQESEGDRTRLALFDETKDSLAFRVSRLETGRAWIEIPETRTRRFVSNIHVVEMAAGMARVRSNFMLFRSRSFSEEWFVVGGREDRWSHSGGWLLEERKITVDHCDLENLSVFL